ncbi:hypothetical protein [Methylobacterium sp. SD21]|uniref:hypothetical protein n=1 Tax=Methylobacterium litchii TaxID=3138810 RepID=UPI00313EA301
MTELDLSHNRALAMRARLSIADSRAQQLVRNWLLVHPEDQATADRNARVVHTCAQVSRTNLDEVGDWDAFAYCFVVSLFKEDADWLCEQSYFYDASMFPHIGYVVQDIFGTRYQGNDVVERFDLLGDAMLVTPSRW